MPAKLRRSPVVRFTIPTGWPTCIAKATRCPRRAGMLRHVITNCRSRPSAVLTRRSHRSRLSVGAYGSRGTTKRRISTTRPVITSESCMVVGSDSVTPNHAARPAVVKARQIAIRSRSDSEAVDPFAERKRTPVPPSPAVQRRRRGAPLDRTKVTDAVPAAPAREILAGLGVRPAGVRVPDVCGEELDGAPMGLSVRGVERGKRWSERFGASKVEHVGVRGS